MSRGAKIGIGAVIAIVVLLVSLVGYIVSAKFTAQKHENGIVAIDKNMQNVHSSVNKILTTSGLTVKNFGNTKINAIKESIKKYSDKPKMMMMWVKENPQNITSKVWEKFQDQVEKQYTKFEMEQKMKISMVQAYNDYLTTTVKGSLFSSGLWDYPKADTKKIMDRVIKTQDTADTWETGIDKPVSVM